MLPDWISCALLIDNYVTTLKPCKCERCAYEWYPRINRYGEIHINTCPACKSIYWNKPRKSKTS